MAEQTNAPAGMSFDARERQRILDQVAELMAMIPPLPPRPAKDDKAERAATNLLNLADHFDRLQSRTKFFVRGAESYADESVDPDPLSRAGMDLMAHFDEFDDFLDLARKGEEVPDEFGGGVE